MNDVPGSDSARLQACASEIARAAREFAGMGWTPATSSNFSMRVDDSHLAITVSGRDKGRLGSDDIMVVDNDGRATSSDRKPSAETALHTQIYRMFPEVNAVLHTHSRVQTVASRLFAAAGVVQLQGYEMVKAIIGHNSHEQLLQLPVFANTQQMQTLVAEVDAWADAGKPLHAYLIDGHGIYAWGRDMDEARRQLEALDFMLACELELRRLNA